MLLEKNLHNQLILMLPSAFDSFGMQSVNFTL